MASKENIVSFFLKNVPSGQVREAVNELRVLCRDDPTLTRAMFHELTRQTVNKSRPLCMVEGDGSKRGILCRELAIGPTTYVSPDYTFCYNIDHVSQKTEVTNTPPPKLSPCLTHIREKIINMSKKFFIPEIGPENDFLPSAISPPNQVLLKDVTVAVTLDSKSEYNITNVLQMPLNSSKEGSIDIILSFLIMHPTSYWGMTWNSHYRVQGINFESVGENMLPKISSVQTCPKVIVDGCVSARTYCWEDASIQLECDQQCHFKILKKIQPIVADGNVEWLEELVEGIDLREKAIANSLVLSLNQVEKTGISEVRKQLPARRNACEGGMAALIESVAQQIENSSLDLETDC